MSFRMVVLPAVVASIAACARATAASPADRGNTANASVASAADEDAHDPARADDPKLAELAHQWQGAWVVRDAAYPGSVEAWEVDGDRARVYDARRARVDEEKFALVSPCRVARTRPIGPGQAAVVTADTFVFAQDGLHVAPAPASGGFESGGVVTACIGDNVYRYNKVTDACARFDVAATQPILTPSAECGIRPEVVGSSFVVRPLEGGSTTELPFYGGALFSASLLAHVAERRSSFADAVAHAAALVKPPVTGK